MFKLYFLALYFLYFYHFVVVKFINSFLPVLTTRIIFLQYLGPISLSIFIKEDSTPGSGFLWEGTKLGEFLSSSCKKSPNVKIRESSLGMWMRSMANTSGLWSSHSSYWKLSFVTIGVELNLSSSLFALLWYFVKWLPSIFLLDCLYHVHRWHASDVACSYLKCAGSSQSSPLLASQHLIFRYLLIN